MPKSLAEGHTKVTILTDANAPADPLNPTVAELNAGIDVSFQVLASDFSFGPDTSDTVQEPALGDDTNSTVYGASNWKCQMTFWRLFDAETGLTATADETGYQAAKTKGTTLHIYVRQNGQKSTEAWAATEEAMYEEVVTDNPQLPSDTSGFVKRVVPMGPQQGAFVTVGAGS